MALTNDDLSIKLYFDLDSNRFRIKDNTDYAGASVSTANVVGVYSYTDPNGNPIYENPDFNNPDIDVDDDVFSSYISFTAVEGVQTVTYSVYDSDADETYSKEFTFTYDADDIPDVVIGIESDVALATIESTDETAYVPLSTRTDTVELNTRTHTLTYPNGKIVESTSTTIHSISLTDLYTGRYVGSVSSNITITNTDDLIIITTITGTQNHDVWDSDGMYAVRAALDTFYDRWITAQTSNPKLARQYAETWNQINSNYAMFNSHKQNGDVENAGEYMNNIKTLLSAEGIDTTIDPSVSVPVSASLPGYASQWLSGSGAPSASLGRIVDFYYRTDTNQVYTKATGTWAVDGTLGANTIIQFSANGSTGWTTTYADGLNYIRFSGDGGATWTVASKFIDGYIYIAYASDDSGTDFICTDETSFTFDASLEYIAIKKFSQEYTDELEASDFEGYFTRYKGEGIAVSVSNIEVPYDPNTDTYTYTNAKSQIILRRGGDDLTTNFTYTKGTESNVTATVGASTGLVSITNMTSSSGYVDVTASKAGVSNISLRVYVNRVNDGNSTIVAYSSVPSVSLRSNSSGDAVNYPSGNDRPSIYVYVGNVDDTNNWSFSISSTNNITASIVDSNVVSLSNILSDTASVDVLCEKSGFDDLYVTIYIHKTKDGRAVIDSSAADGTTIEFKDSWELSGNAFTVTGSAGGGTITSLMSSTRIAFTNVTLGTLRAYDWDGTDWALTGSALSLSGVYGMTALSSTRVALCVGTTLRTYDFNGTTWSQVGNSLTITGLSFPALTKLDSSSITLADDGNNQLSKYTFDGTDWSKVGNSLSVTLSTPSIVYLGSSDIVLSKDGTTIQKYDFDGTDWATDGSEYSLGYTVGIGKGLAYVDSNTIVVVDETNDAIKAYTFGGTTWTSIYTNYDLASASNYGISLFNFPYYVINYDSGSDVELQTVMFQNETLGVKDDGISKDKMDSTAKRAGSKLSGAISTGAPSASELTTILGNAGDYDGGYHVFVEGSSGTGAGEFYLVSTKGSGSTWYYVQLSRSL